LRALEDVVDASMELTVIPSFTKLGYQIRSRLDKWPSLASLTLEGQVIAITGSTSGLGLAAARMCAQLGGHVVIMSRNPDKVARTCALLGAEADPSQFSGVVVDLAEPVEVRRAAEEVRSRHGRLDVLVHNAGALLAERQVNSAGIEVTVASQVLGPFLLTSLLLDLLGEGDGGRVITMASGGMYTATLDVGQLQMGTDDYRGAEQYARAKRAQVTLNELWAGHVDSCNVVFHAMHPGWVDTPGVEASLPRFSKVFGPLLRTADQGADTLVWLTAAAEPGSTTGEFWLDRRQRQLHRLARTRTSDTPEQRQRLWTWCEDNAELSV
jgi:dehydrogenase/reductase SDR family protein 12